MFYYLELVNWLSTVDVKLLLLGNGFHTSFLDSVMWAISYKWFWVPLYLVCALCVFRRLGLRGGIISLVFIVLTIAATDQICATVIRPALCRLRPSAPENPISSMIILVNDYHGGRYGFPSCHAANTFALAIFLSLLFKRRLVTVGLLFWSVMVSYSRIYLGVHYPSDILGGFIIGALIAVICYHIMVRVVTSYRRLVIL